MSKKPLLPLHPVEVPLESPQSLKTNPTYLYRYFFNATPFPPTFNPLRIFRSDCRLGHRFDVEKVGLFPFTWKQYT